MSVRSVWATVFVCCALGAVAAPAACASGLDVSSYSLLAVEEHGVADTQAGSHPFEVRADVTFNENGDTLEDLRLALPVGTVVNPLAVPRCSGLSPVAGSCPDSSAVGVVTVTIASKANLVPVYDMTPAAGEAMRFGFELEGVSVFMEGSVRPGDYGLTLSLSHVSQLVSPEAIALTLWGVPADSRHDEQRGQCLGKTGSCPTANPPAALITLPTACAAKADTETTASADPWQAPGSWSTASASFSAMSGCQRLSFEPMLSVAPDTTQVDEPSGYSIGVFVSQPEGPQGLASSHLQDESVTLPAGTSLSLSASNGLSGCEEAQAELSASGPGTCPDSSKVGIVKITTPLLAHPLEGPVFLASPYANPLEAPVGLYVIAQEALAGVTVKLAGRIALDQTTEQPTLIFEDMPQLPISEFELHLFGGERALLANPSTCGPATSMADLTPWDGGSPFAMSSQFEVGWHAPDEACPSPFPFEPKLQAEPTNPKEGSTTSLVLAVTREGLQNLSKLTFQLPSGFAWGFSSVSACGEPQASQGACPLSSMIGSAIAGLGAGRSLAWLVGPVYLTGGYGGAQYGLSIPLEAVAGPFELGEVVVRAAVAQDASTGALRIATDPLPRMVEGIPLQTRALALAINKHGFVTNPTNCTSQQIGATVEGSQGTTVDLSIPFAAQGCSPALISTSTTQSAPLTASAGRVVIVSPKIIVTGGAARIELRCEGGPCGGKLTIQLKGGHWRRRSRAVTIGVESYSIAASKTESLTVHLDRLGLRLLRARHGRLPATVLLTPTSGRGRIRVVQLLKRTPHRHRKNA
jgi:hypothetical protein